MRTIATRTFGAVICVGILLLATAPGAAADERRVCDDSDGCAVALSISGLIDPVVAEYLTDTVTELGEGEGFVSVVIVLDSDGTVLTDDELGDLVGTLNSASIPVSVWVGPSGIDGRGAKALGGAAELVAAMEYSTAAPGASIGDVGRQRLDRDEFGVLLTSDASRAFTEVLDAQEAADAGIVDAVEPTLGDHVLEVEGVPSQQIVDEDGQAKRQLLTTGVSQSLPLTSQLFHTAASPAVAYLMLGLAIGLLLFEFFTAGVGIAGVVGALLGVMAGYGLSVLPTNSWALALCLLAGVAFFIDIQTAIPRFWTAVGMVAWIVGSLFLFDGVGRPWVALITGIAGMAVTVYSGMPSMVRSRFATPTLGRDEMLGQLGTALSAVDPEGLVSVDGGTWRAITNRATPIAEGESVRVLSIDGLMLEVEPPEGGAKDYREMRDKSPEGAREE